MGAGERNGRSRSVSTGTKMMSTVKKIKPSRPKEGNTKFAVMLRCGKSNDLNL